MGAGWPKPAVLEPFTTIQARDHAKASEHLVFKDNEFDFGVDVVAALLEGDRKTASRRQEARLDGSIINGLAFLVYRLLLGGTGARRCAAREGGIGLRRA